MLSQSYRRPCSHPNMPVQNGWPVGQFQRNANFITDARATTYLFLPAAVNRRVAEAQKHPRRLYAPFLPSAVGCIAEVCCDEFRPPKVSHEFGMDASPALSVI
jgi:hypothetical protein